MLDIKFIRENPEVVKKAAQDKGFYKASDLVEYLLEKDKQRRKLLAELDLLNSERKKNTDREKGKELKESIRGKEEELASVIGEYERQMFEVPNPAAPDVKVGTSEENEILREVGNIPKFSFPIKDHIAIAETTDTLDLERGAKVAQSGFYYVKNGGVLLEQALINFAIQKLVKKGFLPFITPNVAKERNIVGCGYQARSEKERQIYHIEGEDLDLIGTAEITLVGFHADEIIDESRLPLKYAGISSCYRTEAGSYGKDVKGITRVHEFRKVEMVVFCKPEDADKMHDEILEIEEELWSDLKIPYRVVKMATGDLGSAAARKYDIEAWLPSQEKYREVTSTSNTTDFQTRRLNVRMKTGNSTIYPYTLNGTAFATGRTMIAIMENYQKRDGSFEIPKVLRKLVGKKVIEAKK
jgi:seryl-tRNA synthetase